MPNKVKVYGKAQSRTALGIANAYLILNPDVTLDELNAAFPGSLNSTNRCDTIFIDVNDAEKFTNAEGKSNYEMFFFEKEDEVLTLKNGQKVAMQQLWQKEDFDKLVEWVKQYGIEVVECKPIEGFQKGGFTLEYDAAAIAAETAKNSFRVVISIVLHWVPRRCYYALFRLACQAMRLASRIAAGRRTHELRIATCDDKGNFPFHLRVGIFLDQIRKIPTRDAFMEFRQLYAYGSLSVA